MILANPVQKSLERGGGGIRIMDIYFIFNLHIVMDVKIKRGLGGIAPEKKKFSQKCFIGNKRYRTISVCHF